MSDPLLQFDRIGVSFLSDAGTIQAVSDVEFSIARGEVVALVGESGSGKSITALSVAGLLPASATMTGRILFEGRDIAKMKAADRSGFRGGRVAYVFQEPATALNPVFTAGYQIRESLCIHGYKGDLDERVLELLVSVGVREASRVATAYPHQLSGGQQQRVMIAMALAGEPDLLIADEPTTALDVTVQAQILDLLCSIQKKRGMAVLLITHNLAIAAKLAQRLVVMYAGQVVETGPVRNLIDSPRHPYTRALLEAVPRLRDPDRPLCGIPGQIPSPQSPPSGCRFHPRCVMVADKCRLEEPGLMPAGEDRTSRCWFREKLAS